MRRRAGALDDGGTDPGEAQLAGEHQPVGAGAGDDDVGVHGRSPQVEGVGSPRLGRDVLDAYVLQAAFEGQPEGGQKLRITQFPDHATIARLTDAGGRRR